MARPQMWFGTRGQMQWVRTPDSGMESSRVGWSTSSQYLNGGAGVRTSTSAHKEYDMGWNTISRDDATRITDYADGIYDPDSGINLVYFQDPTWLDKNVLPQLWAAPFQQAVEGLTLFPNQKPTLVSTPSNDYGYPARSVQYLANSQSSTLWVPIPPGFTAWIGVHGSVEGTAGITAATTSGTTNSTPLLLDTLPVTTATRFSDSFDAGSGVDGILLGLLNNGPGATDTFTWAGTMVQILPTGQTPENGRFVSGQGHSGCQFDEKPTVSVTYLGNKSKDDGQLSLGVHLVETGSWL